VQYETTLHRNNTVRPLTIQTLFPLIYDNIIHIFFQQNFYAELIFKNFHLCPVNISNDKRQVLFFKKYGNLNFSQNSNLIEIFKKIY